MARRTQYHPKFSLEEIEQARHLLRQHEAPYAQVQRARLAVYLHENPDADSVQVAEVLQLHKQTVRKWRKRWAQHGFSLTDEPRSGRPRRFSPPARNLAVAMTCGFVARHEQPLSRLSLNDLLKELISHPFLERLSRTTLARWLKEHAIKPWRYRSLLFPRDPNFLEKAERALDLYAGYWQGEPLSPDDYVISADEKTGLQTRERCHPLVPGNARHPMLVEHEYRRHGTLAYLAALGVRSGVVMRRTEPTHGIEPFNRLVHQVMRRRPYRNARRVFWIVDNGSSHQPKTFPQRLQQLYPNAIAVHLPIHASSLNQIEIFFSILQRKALSADHAVSLADRATRILDFQSLYNKTAKSLFGGDLRPLTLRHVWHPHHCDTDLGNEALELIRPKGKIHYIPSNNRSKTSEA